VKRKLQSVGVMSGTKVAAHGGLRRTDGDRATLPALLKGAGFVCAVMSAIALERA